MKRATIGNNWALWGVALGLGVGGAESGWAGSWSNLALVPGSTERISEWYNTESHSNVYELATTWGAFSWGVLHHSSAVEIDGSVRMRSSAGVLCSGAPVTDPRLSAWGEGMGTVPSNAPVRIVGVRAEVVSHAMIYTNPGQDCATWGIGHSTVTVRNVRSGEVLAEQAVFGPGALPAVWVPRGDPIALGVLSCSDLRGGQTGEGLSLDVAVRLQSSADDTNNNEIADAWEEAYGLTNATGTTDTDDDGVTDLGEYWSGTDPTNPASCLRLVGTWPAGPDLVAVAWTSAPSRLYGVEASTNMPHYQVITEGVFATPPVNVCTAAGGGSRGFYRVKAE